jgi:hypothetical protein
MKMLSYNSCLSGLHSDSVLLFSWPLWSLFLCYSIQIIWFTMIHSCWSQWPCGIRHKPFSPAQTLVSWVRIPLKAWMSVCAYSLCVGNGLVTGSSAVQGVLPSAQKKISNWKSGQGLTKGCRAIEREMIYKYALFCFSCIFISSRKLNLLRDVSCPGEWLCGKLNIFSEEPVVAIISILKMEAESTSETFVNIC